MTELEKNVTFLHFSIRNAQNPTKLEVSMHYRVTDIEVAEFISNKIQNKEPFLLKLDSKITYK